MINELLTSNDLVGTLMTKLDGVATNLFDSFKSQAIDLVIKGATSAALKGLEKYLVPAAGASSLLDGLKWLTSPEMKANLQSIFQNVLGTLDKILNGTPDEIGASLVKLLDEAIPTLLPLLQRQLMGSFNLPKEVQALLNAVDLRTWIEKGVQTLWEKVKAKLSDAVLGSVDGVALSDALPVGDPLYIRAYRKGSDAAVITIDNGHMENISAKLCIRHSVHYRCDEPVPNISEYQEFNLLSRNLFS